VSVTPTLIEWDMSESTLGQNALRRRLLIGALSLATTRCIPSFAQGKIPVVGLLDGGARVFWWSAFRRQMNDLGYTEGKNVTYRTQLAHGDFKKLQVLADELVRSDPAVIVTASTAATLAVKRSTDSVPIVTATGADHVSLGLASTMARPGGNVTGMTSLASDLTPKRVELLRVFFPQLSRLAVLWQSDNPGSTIAFRELEMTARESKIALQNVGVKKADEIPAAFSAAAGKHAQVVFVIGGPLTVDEREQIASLARQHQMPTMATISSSVDGGCLMSYGVHYEDMFRRAALFVDKILKGAKPADLPIEQPTRFELVINRKTADALRLTIPDQILLRADRIIE
jgi:putative tryptophan/tyrosine transport system substrate-binding protein